MPNYITLFIGILFANILLIFGLMMSPLLAHYQNEIQDKLIAQHQYVLKVPVEVDNDEAEKYCAKTLSTIDGRLKSEDVLIYGAAITADILILIVMNLNRVKYMYLMVMLKSSELTRAIR